jgi:hypothetical protein
MAAREQMRERSPRLHVVKGRIEGAEAHGTGLVLDGHIGLIEEGPHPAGEEPRPRQVRIEQKSPICEGGSILKIADDIGKRNPAVQSATASSWPSSPGPRNFRYGGICRNSPSPKTWPLYPSKAEIGGVTDAQAPELIAQGYEPRLLDLR